MGLGRSAAVVIGSFPLGESDRVVSFFSRDFGRLRGVARAARRLKSRFGGSLELFTLGQLVFFDTGRSELVRIDHFDVTHPFGAVREDLGRLGEAAWVVEIVARTTGERDRQPALYGLLVRALRAMTETTRPPRVAACFGVRCLDLLGTGPGSTAASSAGAGTRFRARPWARAGWCARRAPGARASTPHRCRRRHWRPSIGCGRYAGRKRWPRRSVGRDRSCARCSTPSWPRSSASRRGAAVFCES